MLRLQVAGLAAIETVVLPIHTKPHLVRALAQAAIFFAQASVFHQVANGTTKCVCHARNV
jgi:hypothetical protein